MSIKDKYIGAKTPSKPHTAYVLRLADNAMIMGQRLSEMCGHGPEMELDMALVNFSLDFIGQASLLYERALELENLAPSVDALAMTRDLKDYTSCLLVVQPNVDFAHIMLRQYLFSTFQKRQYEALLGSSDETLAAIAEKSLKEISYHIRFSKDWVLRLGDGTEESHARIENALGCLWRYTGELFDHDELVGRVVKSGLSRDFTKSYQDWQDEVVSVLTEAGELKTPETLRMLKGGHHGSHDEQLGHILKDMQFMQLRYPGLTW